MSHSNSDTSNDELTARLTQRFLYETLCTGPQQLKFTYSEVYSALEFQTKENCITVHNLAMLISELNSGDHHIPPVGAAGAPQKSRKKQHSKFFAYKR